MNSLDPNNIVGKSLIVFDMDDTLAKSKTMIDQQMSTLFCELLSVRKVAVISGGSFNQFKKELLDPLGCVDSLKNLHIFPTDGNAYYAWQMGISAETQEKSQGIWQKVYEQDLSVENRTRIIDALHEMIAELGIVVTTQYGEQIEDRGGQITFSGLGQSAPLELKETWDPDRKIRERIKGFLDKKLPDFEMTIAGKTSVDITMPSHDKAYAITKILEALHIKIENIVYIGDALFEGGNDHPVIATGADTISVKDPEDTKGIIREILHIIKSN